MKTSFFSILFIFILALQSCSSEGGGDTPNPDPDPDTVDCELGFTGASKCYDSYFEGLYVTPGERENFATNIDQFTSLLKGNLSGLRNPMWSIKNKGEWVIYYHFEEWQDAVTAKAITNMTAKYEEAAKEWMSRLKTFDADAPSAEDFSIKVFGFVFNEGVTVDASVYEVYGDYPIVTNWNRADETSPWVVAQRSTNAISDQNWYAIYDFNSLKVVGNRTLDSPGAVFSPSNWSTYTHPEGVDMFFTKYWHKVSSWDAVAQRQYLKMGQAVTDYENGEVLTNVLKHEMGHCFFHDDIYALDKYPQGANINSVMNRSENISNFDQAVQRIIWEEQKKQ